MANRYPPVPRCCLDDPARIKHTHEAKLDASKGLNPGDPAVKFDGAKNRLDLIPLYPLVTLGEIYTFGAKKYEDDNWRKGMKWSRIYGAVLRHLFAFWRGEEIDPESGLPHLAHAIWGLFTLLEFTRTRREFDDRKDVVSESQVDRKGTCAP